MKNFICILLFFLPLFSFADSWCDDVIKKAQEQQDRISPSESGYKVSSNDRLYFYSAPDEKCKLKKTFIIKGDLVDAYSIYNGFVYVIYFTNANEDVVGWVKLKGLESTGTGMELKQE